MPPSVRGKLNDGVGGYGFAVVGRAYEGQEGSQHLLLVIIYILYTVAIFGRGLSSA